MEIKQVPAHTNNYGVGRVGNKVEYIIMHWIVGTLESCDATFQNKDRHASSHYGIGDDEIHQYVGEENTAWHASNLLYNRKSIGIEHEGGWESPKDSGKRVKPTKKTHETSALLVATLAKKYNIPLDRTHILKHNEVPGAATSCSGTLDVDLIISLAKAQVNKPIKDTEIDFDDGEGNRHTVGWYVYEWFVEKTEKNKKIKEMNDAIETVKQESFAEGVKKGRESEIDRISKQLGILEIPEPKEDFDFAKWKVQQVGSTQSSFITKLIGWLTSQKG